MKKLLMLVSMASLALTILAEEAPIKAAESRTQSVERRREQAMWPSFFAIGNYNDALDVAGFRLTIPYSTRQENVTGFDLGFWGRAQYFEGFQLNIFRNDVVDDMSGLQIGLYNSIAGGDMFAMQIGLWNEAQSVVGLQVGLVNTCGDAEGLQIGLINRCETMHGYQVGVINIIRAAELQFFPVLNIGF